MIRITAPQLTLLSAIANYPSVFIKKGNSTKMQRGYLLCNNQTLNALHRKSYIEIHQNKAWITLRGEYVLGKLSYKGR